MENLELPENPLGEFFRVDNEWCKIVGIMERRGDLLGISQDDYVLLPYQTARRIMGASQNLDIQVQMLVDDLERRDEIREIAK